MSVQKALAKAKKEDQRLHDAIEHLVILIEDVVLAGEKLKAEDTIGCPSGYKHKARDNLIAELNMNKLVAEVQSNFFGDSVEK